MRGNSSHSVFLKGFLCVFLALGYSSLHANPIQAPATRIFMNVIGGCEFANAPQQGSLALLGTLDFGKVYRLNSIADATSSPGNGSIQVRCTPGVTAKVTLGEGLYSLGTNQRRMKMTAVNQYLFYQLYTNTARTLIWDNTTGQSLNFMTDEIKTLTVYGRMPIQTGVQPGTYADTITVTVTW